MIVKVQRPIYSEYAELLVYNKSREVRFILPQNEHQELVKKMGKEYKIFVEAEMIDADHINFGDRVEDQNW